MRNVLSRCKANSLGYSFAPYKPLVLCDFDGTISLGDVTDNLLTQFAKKEWEGIEKQWLKGQIGSKECLHKQISLINASKTQINHALEQIKIDPWFITFVEQQKNDFSVQIVSDGLDYAINYILKCHGCGVVPIAANKFYPIYRCHWKIDFPYSSPSCVTASGNCKCQHVKSQRKHFNPIFYVGDGASDFCVSRKVDLVFAKDKLIDYCKQNKINYYPINGFEDVLALLQTQIISCFWQNPRVRNYD